LNIHIDAVSFVFGMFNFAVVGTVGVLFAPVPLLVKQGYMVWTGIITAYIFTWVPEWTSWVLICVMALYDIAAVLIPGGPLNVSSRACATIGHAWRLDHRTQA
jgi:presenilin 1